MTFGPVVGAATDDKQGMSVALRVSDSRVQTAVWVFRRPDSGRTFR